MNYSKKLMFQVGFFLLVTLALIVVVVTVLGKERSLFEETTQLFIKFSNVQGLRTGAMVQLGGVNVGSVVDIKFPETLEEASIIVSIEVNNSVMERVRENSMAQIVTQGLLGDKVVQLTMGSKDKLRLRNGQFINPIESGDMLAMLSKAGEILDNGVEVVKGIRKAVDRFSNDATVGHVQNIIASIDDIMKEIEQGKGLIHGLIYDGSPQKDFRDTVKNARLLSESLVQTSQDIHGIVRQVSSGNGTVHHLIYNDDGRKITKDLREAAASIRDIAQTLQTEEGVIHNLIYKEDKSNIIKNLADATEDLKLVTAEIREGRGTIGGLVFDPTIYEDVKTILGNVKRNKVLKALVRMAIKRNEAEGDARRVYGPELPPELQEQREKEVQETDEENPETIEIPLEDLEKALQEEILKEEEPEETTPSPAAAAPTEPAAKDEPKTAEQPAPSEESPANAPEAPPAEVPENTTESSPETPAETPAEDKPAAEIEPTMTSNEG